MIKKHLIACSAIFLLTVLIKFGVSRTAPSRIDSFPQQVDVPSEEKEEKGVSSKKSLKTLEFANEKVPLQDAKVAWRMNKHLRAHSYRNLGTNKLHQKAARWFPVIEPILKLHGIPEDFKYIPLVESGFGDGVSHRGAAGYWQFMPGTARTYGLKVNDARDDRKNIRKSTVAACKYLNELFKEFKSWTLVAAAYNTGENNLRREMYRQGKRNYFKLKLNRETATYLYKIVSVKEIIEKPAQYGFVKRNRTLLASKENQVSKPADFLSLKVDNSGMAIPAFQMN
jgi:membrane-bound lytic murein transglycosylase D